MKLEYPIQDVLDNIFHIIQGHQITDEELYNSHGEIPVYTGSNVIKGFWNKSIVKKEILPCLTYATKAFDGTITLQTEIFDANNTAVLYLKEPYKEIILLEWIQCILPNIFLKVSTSKEGVSYLNKEIVKNISITIPEKEIQKNQIEILKRLKSDYYKLKHVQILFDRLANKNLIVNYNKYQAKGISIKQCLDYLGGNSGLTEEAIYQTLQMKGKRYTVLSSATLENNKMGSVVQFNLNGKLLKIYEGDGLLVIRKGKAGMTQYLPKGSYTINDDAYILYLKHNCPYQINIQWLRLQYRNKFLDFASSSDNGTWNMTGFFKYTYIDIPDYKEQLNVVEMYSKIENKYTKLLELSQKCEKLLSKEISIDG